MAYNEGYTTAEATLSLYRIIQLFLKNKKKNTAIKASVKTFSSNACWNLE
jgi:hypothetical protein